MHLSLAATIGLVAVAGLASFVDAIAGGGGLLTLPALLSAGLSSHLSLGTNKGQSVLGSGAATLRFWRAGTLARRRSQVSFAAAFAGSLGGAALVSHVDAHALEPIIIGLLVAAAALVLMPRPRGGTPARRPLAVATVIAVVVGFYDGFFGPGTGTLLIVAFMWLLADEPAAASGNAKVVNFGSNLAAVAWFGSHGLVVWSVALPMAAGQFVGGFLGAHTVLTRGGAVVRVAAVVVALAMIAKLTWQLVA
ncbi:MAG TPA: TSUP family transporter [Kofleriaceae bacterium]|nr:TSUP family transporter [Kofleriaceae bacterium]